MIQQRIKTILQKIEFTKQKFNIKHAVNLVAVSKTKSVEEIKEAYDLGIRHFGENYVDQIQEKQPKLPIDIKWHFIGHLQSNKIKKVLVPNLDVLQTVDRESLADKLNKLLQTQNTRTLKILLQVKTSEEQSKNGCQVNQVQQLYKYIVQKCPRLQFKGLMTIGKQGDLTAFQVMYDLKKKLCETYKLNEDEFQLSMGMSGDFQTAIQYHSTSVRVGSLIFGQRNYPKKQSQKSQQVKP